MLPSGFLYINKPQGITSYDVIRYLKRKLPVKMGHAGTLDPSAMGLLIVALDRATKFVEFFQMLEKEYIATIRLGLETETYDMEGKTVRIDENFKLDRNELERILESFPRKYVQIPPKYSAKKVGGRRAYELARKSKDFSLKGKEVSIYNLELLNVDEENNEFTVLLVVSTGFFVRSFAMDVAKMLNTVGTLKLLVRTRIGNIDLKQAQLLDEEPRIVPIEEALSFLPELTIEERFAKIYINGGKLFVGAEDGMYRVFVGKTFLGVGEVKRSVLKSKKLALRRI